jgi:cytochrome c oxidase assembly factor CtaG
VPGRSRAAPGLTRTTIARRLTGGHLRAEIGVPFVRPVSAHRTDEPLEDLNMPHPGLGDWVFDPVFILALAALAVAYSSACRRLRARGTPVGAGHWLPFAAGLFFLALALLSPLDPIGDSWLLSAHMLQHLLLADIAPALLVLGLRAPILPLGLPRELLRRTARRGTLGRIWHAATRPWIALPAWALATWIWSIPAIFDAAAAYPLLHATEHATLLWTGVALWWLIVDPLPSDRRRPHGQRLAILGFTRAASAAVCIPLTWLGHTIYPRYAEAPRAYGIPALTDQQIAGAGMCFLEFLVFGTAFAVVFLDILVREERETLGRERRATS